MVDFGGVAAIADKVMCSLQFTQLCVLTVSVYILNRVMALELKSENDFMQVLSNPQHLGKFNPMKFCAVQNACTN